MKPLTDTEAFLQRFNNFQDGEIRSVEIVSPTTMKISLTAQDSARAFDWVCVSIEFSEISDAKILDDSKLAILDMQEGISLLKEDKLFAFAYGKCYNLSSIKSSTLFIVATSIKYEEGNF